MSKIKTYVCESDMFENQNVRNNWQVKTAETAMSDLSERVMWQEKKCHDKQKKS